MARPTQQRIRKLETALEEEAVMIGELRDSHQSRVQKLGDSLNKATDKITELTLENRRLTYDIFRLVRLLSNSESVFREKT